jgi:hypothetical protein
MSYQTLSTPIVKINGDQYAIVPNSLKYQAGRAMTTVRAADAGNGATESVHSRNVEEAFSKVSFDMFVTTELDSLIATISENVGRNTVEFAENLADGTSTTRSFTSVSLTNDPELNPTADGVATLEFAGNTMVLA